MGKSSSGKHIHKYIRDKLGWKTKSNKKYIYKCAWPNCSHYLPLHLAENKLSVCWRCGNPFMMTKAQLRMKKPHCNDCYKGQRENLDKLKNLLADDRFKEILK